MSVAGVRALEFGTNVCQCLVLHLPVRPSAFCSVLRLQRSSKPLTSFTLAMHSCSAWERAYWLHCCSCVLALQDVAVFVVCYYSALQYMVQILVRMGVLTPNTRMISLSHCHKYDTPVIRARTNALRVLYENLARL